MKYFAEKRVAVCFLFLIVSTFWCGSALAHEPEEDNLWSADFRTIKEHLEPSYLTFGGGYDLENKIKLNDIYYEGELFAHVQLWEKLDYKNHAFRLYLPIRVQLRQFRSNSSPVKTPSYNPGIKLYYLYKGFVLSENNFHYFSLGLHHYSNGQSGTHYDPVTGAINDEDGSFSSDYLEGSLYGVNENSEQALWPHWYKLNMRAYLLGLTWEDPQTNYYERFLVEGSSQLLKWGDDFPSELKLTVGYRFGRKYVSPGKNAGMADNFQYKGEFQLKPVAWGWEQMSLYLRWDMGYDYYNINYQKKVNRLQFGVVGSLF